MSHSLETLTPLVSITRSGQVESRHAGSIAVVDTNGRLVAHAGDPELGTYWRSVAKIHQAIPLIIAGGVSRFDLSEAELAIMCASHRGEQGQIKHVAEILRKAGASVSALRCGTQEPLSPTAAAELIRAEACATPLHNTCSGNHAGLIAFAKLLGADASRYDEKEEAVQKSALAMVAKFSDLDPSEVLTGLDGCGIPTYRTPLWRLALAFGRLATVPIHWPTEIKSAVDILFQAIAQHPDLLSGAGELDAALVRAFNGEGLCKLGAESVSAAAFRSSPRWPSGLGIAIKVSDGLGNRARDVILADCLEQLQVGTAEQRANFERSIQREIKTRRGETAGEIRTVFKLEFSAKD